MIKLSQINRERRPDYTSFARELAESKRGLTTDLRSDRGRGTIVPSDHLFPFLLAHADVFATPDRVAGIPAFLLGRNRREARFIYVGDWENRGTEGFSFALIPEGPPWDGFRSYDSDIVPRGVSFCRPKGSSVPLEIARGLTSHVSEIEIQTEK